MRLPIDSLLNSPAKQEAEGKWDETKGNAKKAWGDLTDDESTYAEGVMDQAKGKAKQVAADARQKLDDLTD